MKKKNELVVTQEFVNALGRLVDSTNFNHLYVEKGDDILYVTVSWYSELYNEVVNERHIIHLHENDDIDDDCVCDCSNCELIDDCDSYDDMEVDCLSPVIDDCLNCEENCKRKM